MLFLLATAWALLPAFTDLKLGFPRSWITVGLAAWAWLLTLFAWLDSFDGDFSIWAAARHAHGDGDPAVRVLALLPELRNRPALPGGLATPRSGPTSRRRARGQQRAAAAHGPGQQTGPPTPPGRRPPQQSQHPASALPSTDGPRRGQPAADPAPGGPAARPRR